MNIIPCLKKKISILMYNKVNFLFLPQVFHSTSGLGKNDKPLGSFIIGGGLCARGKELEHWSDMLQKPEMVVKEWHSLKS